MNRERIAWTVSVGLIALLAFQLPGSLAQRDDDYSFVRTLVDIHRQVASSYVDPVDESKLREGAIEGMLGELDPFSVYVPPRIRKNSNACSRAASRASGFSSINSTAERWKSSPRSTAARHLRPG